MELISPTSYKHLKKWFQIKWLNGHPYVWNDELNAPEMTKSNTSITLWSLSVIVFFVNFTFVQCRTVQVHLDTTATAVVKMYMTLTSALWCYEALLRIFGIYKRREIVEVLQQFFRFVETCSPEEGTRTAQMSHSKTCELFLLLTFYCLWINTFLFICLIVIMPSSPEFYSSLLPNAQDLNLITRLAFTLYHFYVVTTAIHNNGMIIACLAVYIFPAARLARMPACMIKSDGGHSQVQKAFRFYRHNLLQVQRFSEVFQLANGGSYLLEVAATIVCIYGAIRLEGLLSAFCAGDAFMFTVFALGLVNTLAEVNKGSQESMECFRRQVAVRFTTQGRGKMSLWRQKYLRQIAALKINFGPICYCDKQLVLTTMGLIIVNSANLLLAA